jgi:hypothetical protein
MRKGTLYVPFCVFALDRRTPSGGSSDTRRAVFLRDPKLAELHVVTMW